MTKQLIVVQGVIIKPNKTVLMAHRPPDKKKPLMWEYPGGKVEPGETLEEGLARELKEELDIDAKIGKNIANVNFYWKEDVYMHLFAVTEWQGDPKPLVASELRWVSPEDAVDWLPCLPGFFLTYRQVIRFLSELP